MTQTGANDEAALREELAVFGLSDTEIDTYLALLARGEATTSAVSEDADVTQRAVYNIAERLENRGLVRVNDHASPTTIRALPPKEAMGGLADRLESITPSLEARFNETQPKTPEIRMVKSRETAFKRLRNAISAAEREVFVAVPENCYAEIEPELRDAVDRGLLVLLLLGDADEVEDAESRFEGTADVVRRWGERLPFLYATDDRSAMIGDAGILSGTHTDEDAVSVSQQNLAGSILGLYLSGYWPAATEVYVRDPYPLPRTFEWFRQATFHAMLHHLNGEDLRVEIETSDGEMLSGRVSQIRQAIIEPATNAFTLENSLFVETAEGEVSVGGQGSFVEEYEAEVTTIRTEQ
jgi:sugar-specific transcriptional regulator TrmB